MRGGPNGRILGPTITPFPEEQTISEVHKRAVPAPEELTALVLETLDDNKAEEIVILPLEGKTDIARQMILASGRSARHVGALADHLEARLRDVGVRPSIEGFPSCDWVLLDTGDIIVHLFRPEVRTYYNLEKMWGPAIAHLATARDGEAETGAEDTPHPTGRADYDPTGGGAGFDPVLEPENPADLG